MLGAAAAGAQRPVPTLVHPVGRSVDAAALQFALHIVPRGHVIVIRLADRRLQPALQRHFQIRLEADRRDADGQLHYEDNCQAHGKLMQCGSK